MNDEARTLPIRHLYRTLILRGGVRIPRRYAEMLVGPDCAYRLYDAGSGPEKRGARGKRRKRPR